MKRSTKTTIRAYSAIVPALLYFGIFSIVPIFMLFYYALREYRIIWRVNDFIGFDNFVQIFSDNYYTQSLLITLFIAVLIVAVGMVTGFLLALGVNRIRHAQGAMRTLYYIPAVLPMAVVSVLLNVLLKSDGAMNRIFESLGIGKQDWYHSTAWMYFWIVLIVTWKGIGGTALLFIAGLNGVDQSIYEAAKIDGANRWTMVWRITVPLIRPMLGFILITGFIGAFGLFEPVQLISQGGPDQSTKVIFYMIYDEAFLNDNQGLASAISVIVFFFVLICTWINSKITDDSMFKAD